MWERKSRLPQRFPPVNIIINWHWRRSRVRTVLYVWENNYCRKAFRIYEAMTRSCAAVFIRDGLFCISCVNKLIIMKQEMFLKLILRNVDHAVVLFFHDLIGEWWNNSFTIYFIADEFTLFQRSLKCWFIDGRLHLIYFYTYARLEYIFLLEHY